MNKNVTNTLFTIVTLLFFFLSFSFLTSKPPLNTLTTMKSGTEVLAHSGETMVMSACRRFPRPYTSLPPRRSAATPPASVVRMYPMKGNPRICPWVVALQSNSPVCRMIHLFLGYVYKLVNEFGGRSHHTVGCIHMIMQPFLHKLVSYGIMTRYFSNIFQKISVNEFKESCFLLNVYYDNNLPNSRCCLDCSGEARDTRHCHWCRLRS